MSWSDYEIETPPLMRPYVDVRSLHDFLNKVVEENSDYDPYEDPLAVLAAKKARVELASEIIHNFLE